MTLDVKIFDPNTFRVFTFDIDKVDVETVRQTSALLTKYFGKNFILLPNCFDVFPKITLKQYKNIIDKLLKDEPNV